ncbi:hypothetical protein [Paenibacillus oralis]|uniref:hypothetical protein n=1 Tax=Paenibacillus oralis TaxID=2490856 RepID=UPI0015A8264A|nr:hypothetical protein [Paenibacillus oralis]
MLFSCGDIGIVLKEHQPLSLEFTTVTGELEWVSGHGFQQPDGAGERGIVGKAGSGK